MFVNIYIYTFTHITNPKRHQVLVVSNPRSALNPPNPTRQFLNKEQGTEDEGLWSVGFRDWVCWLVRPQTRTPEP